MEVQEKDARKMLVSCGFEKAQDWGLKKLALKVNALPGDVPAPEDAEDLTLLRRITQALADGEEVKVIEDHDKPAKPKAGKAKTAATKAKDGDDQDGKRKGRPSGLLGMRGERQLRLNAFLSRRSKTPEELAAESGVDLAWVKKHCAYWARKGVFEKTSKGYCLPSGSKVKA